MDLAKNSIKEYSIVRISSIERRDDDWNNNPASIYLFKVSSRSTRTMCEIFSKLTIKAPERHRWFYGFYRHLWIYLNSKLHLNLKGSAKLRMLLLRLLRIYFLVGILKCKVNFCEMRIELVTRTEEGLLPKVRIQASLAMMQF